MFSEGETLEEADANLFDAVQPVLAYHRNEARQQGHSSQVMSCPMLQKPGPELEVLQSHQDAVLSFAPGRGAPRRQRAYAGAGLLIQARRTPVWCAVPSGIYAGTASDKWDQAPRKAAGNDRI